MGRAAVVADRRIRRTHRSAGVSEARVSAAALSAAGVPDRRRALNRAASPAGREVRADFPVRALEVRVIFPARALRRALNRAASPAGREVRADFPVRALEVRVIFPARAPEGRAEFRGQSRQRGAADPMDDRTVVETPPSADTTAARDSTAADASTGSFPGMAVIAYGWVGGAIHSLSH